MFDAFQVPALFVINQTILSLYASGRTTGCVLESGESESYISSVVEGFIVPHTMKHLGFAGKQLNDYLIELLSNNKQSSFSTIAEKDIAQDIKEKLCYVSSDFHKELRDALEEYDEEVLYELSGGNVIIVGKERFQVPEAIFKPSLMGKDDLGIHEGIIGSICKCDDANARAILLGNVVLCGGTTLFPGLADRLTRKLEELNETDAKVSVLARPDRRYAAWIGGSILSSLMTFQQMWITRDQYNELGPASVHRAWH